MDRAWNALGKEGPLVEAHDELEVVATSELLAELLALDGADGDVGLDGAHERIRHRVHISCSTRWTIWTQIEPSPTAEATRLTLVERASPTQNTAGMLVSMR